MNDDFWAISTPPPVAVGTGLLALDIIIKGNKDKPHMVKTGGSFGNIITILSYLGWETFPIARLGDDDIAAIIKDDISAFGVNINFILTEKLSRTPIVIEKLYNDTLDRPKHSFRLSCPHCNSWFPRYKPLILKQVNELVSKLPNASVFYFDRLAPAVLKLAEYYYKRGALIVFEPAKISDIKLFTKCLEICHILKYHEGNLNGLEELVKSYNTPLEIETLGSKGLRYRTKNGIDNVSKWSELKTYDVGEIKDTAGAGDWCTAGLIHTLGQYGSNGFIKLGIQDYIKALKFSQALAAFGCKFEGPRGGMYLLKKNEFIKNIDLILKEDTNLKIEYTNNFIAKDKHQLFCPKCNQLL